MKFKPTRAALIAGIQICVSALFAQESKLTVSPTYNQDRSVDFNYTKDNPGTFTVIVKFRNLTNSLSSERQVEETRGYNGKLLTLKPNNANQSIGFSYSYTYLRGKLKPKFKPEFVYLLPYKNGKSVRVSEAGYVAARYFGNTAPADWKAYNFYTSQEDTVTAIRKGIVVEVKDVYETSDIDNAVYTSKKNEIIVEHGDGTLCSYKGFKKGIFVKVGETVLPGSALGMNSRFQAKSKEYNTAVQVYYLKADEIEVNEGASLKDSKTLYGFITPHFYTASVADVILKDRETYIAGISPEVVQKELTKKELKNLGSK
jgi:hypothetical protein